MISTSRARAIRRRALPVLLLAAGLAAGLPSGPRSASAQSETIDRVAAIVNDDIILQSEVEEQLAVLEASHQVEVKDSTQAAEIRKQVLDQLIDERLIIDYATKEGITVTEEAVEEQVNQSVKNAQERMGSEEAFKKELERQGMTLDTLKDRYRQDIKKQMTAQRIVDKEIRRKIKITDADVDTFFQHNKDQLPAKPSQFHLAHILVIPKAEASRRAAARAKAEDVLHKLDAGGDWEKLVAQYSEDPSTAQNGGDLGEVGEGDLDQDFETAVKALEPGQHSGLVETKFGYHIIQLVSRNGKRYHARHILVLVQPSPEDTMAGIQRAQKAREEVLKGGDWAAVVNTYSDDVDSKPSGGDLGMIPVSALSRQNLAALDSLKVGGISAVLEGPTGYHVFKVLGREEGGTYTLAEVREQLSQMLSQKKLSEEYDRWIAGIRKKSFIEIKKS